MRSTTQDNILTVLSGDSLHRLKQLDDESVNCCVTSPPYWGLRDYGVKGQIGLETLHDCRAWATGWKECGQCYICRIMAVFREVKRVLRGDGTLWLNMGDSYASKMKNRTEDQSMRNSTLRNPGRNQYTCLKQKSKVIAGLKPKDLVGIPWMLAFALRDDGWYLRQDIIWSKPNPMPESVSDRCTKAHEYLFLLSKSQSYYYDQDAIKEPAALTSMQRWAQNIDEQTGSNRVPGKTNGNMKAVGGPKSHKGSRFDTGKTAKHQLNRAQQGERVNGNLPGRDDGGAACNKPGQEMRNRRSVWTVATHPYCDAHFATYPPNLIKPCILAGCPTGGVVLDPFAGSGTTGMVALELGRRAVLIELNPEYLDMINHRTQTTIGMNI